MATISRKSQYIGFTVDEKSRVYQLRVTRPDGESRDFLLRISNRAFLSNRVRYQDAPEICFIKLERALEACAEDSLPASNLQVTEADLEEYREAHNKKPVRRGF